MTETAGERGERVGGPELTSRIRDELLARLGSEPVRSLCREFGVKELAVFGSLLGEEFSEGSDVDLLVEFQPGNSIGLIAFCRLGRLLTECMGIPVDLVPKQGLKPLIRESVLSSARTVYAA